jgi:hypothetical protein
LVLRLRRKAAPRPLWKTEAPGIHPYRLALRLLVFTRLGLKRAILDRSQSRTDLRSSTAGFVRQASCMASSFLLHNNIGGLSLCCWMPWLLGFHSRTHDFGSGKSGPRPWTSGVPQRLNSSIDGVPSRGLRKQATASGACGSSPWRRVSPVIYTVR